MKAKGAKLDELQAKYDVIFVVAGTNDEDFENGKKRVGSPADSLCSLVVNSVRKDLIKEPSLLLLDEPFSNLDEARREKERKLLKSIIKEKGLTVIIATHLQEDVLALGDEIYLLEEGKITFSLKKEELAYSSHPLIRAMMASHVAEDIHG